LAAWSDDCFEESNVEINCHMGKRKTHPMAARCRRDSKLRCNPGLVAETLCLPAAEAHALNDLSATGFRRLRPSAETA
jgi:hypothetical protein